MSEIKKTFKSVDGNTAASMESYYFTEVAAIYPITPSSPMAENVDAISSKGEKNFFGSPVKVVEMQSEAGASGAAASVVISSGADGFSSGTSIPSLITFSVSIFSSMSKR